MFSRVRNTRWFRALASVVTALGGLGGLCALFWEGFRAVIWNWLSESGLWLWQYFTEAATAPRLVALIIIILVVVAIWLVWQALKGKDTGYRTSLDAESTEHQAELTEVHEHYRDQDETIRRLEHLVNFELRLLGLLGPGIPPKKTREEALQQVLQDLLEKAVEIYQGDICRAYICRPGNDKSGFLEIWAHYGFDGGTLPHRKYNVRDNWRGIRGVAAFTYRTGRLQVVQIRERNGQWIGIDADTGKEHKDYIPEGNNDLIRPKYRSFATVAIRGFDERSIAVLNLDSEQYDTFLDRKDKVLLDDIAASMGAVILTFNHFVEPRSTRA